MSTQSKRNISTAETNKQTDTRTTRHSSDQTASINKRRRGNESPPSSFLYTDEYDTNQINNARDARKFLESRLLLVPDGATPTPNVMSTALFQIAAMQGVPGLAMRAIRAAAYLMEEIEEEAIAITTRDAVADQMTYMMEEMKNITEHLKETITAEIANQIKTIEETTTAALKQIKEAKLSNQDGNHNKIEIPHTQIAGRMATRGKEIDPRIAAREGIKARQLLLDFPQISPIHNVSNTEVKNIIQKAINQACVEDITHEIRSTERLPNKGILIEMLTDEGAKWIKSDDNMCEIFAAMGEQGRGGKWRKRTHNIIAYYVPIAFDPENEDHLEEIMDNNKIPHEDLAKVRYAKPIERRSPNQRYAHLILSIHNPDTANRLINQGMFIFGKTVEIRKCKKEPIRCLKCHGYNHMAKECVNNYDTCGTCSSKTHKTRECTNKPPEQCIPCGGADHPSWSRQCPTFLRKCEDFDRAHPENSIPYFPSSEEWTWSSNYPPPRIRHQLTDQRSGTRNEIDIQTSTQSNIERSTGSQLTQTRLNFGLVNDPWQTSRTQHPANKQAPPNENIDTETQKQKTHENTTDKTASQKPATPRRQSTQSLSQSSFYA